MDTQRQPIDEWWARRRHRGVDPEGVAAVFVLAVCVYFEIDRKISVRVMDLWPGVNACHASVAVWSLLAVTIVLAVFVVTWIGLKNYRLPRHAIRRFLQYVFSSEVVDNGTRPLGAKPSKRRSHTIFILVIMSLGVLVMLAQVTATVSQCQKEPSVMLAPEMDFGFLCLTYLAGALPVYLAVSLKAVQPRL